MDLGVEILGGFGVVVKEGMFAVAIGSTFLILPTIFLDKFSSVHKGLMIPVLCESSVHKGLMIPVICESVYIFLVGMC